MLDLDGPNIPNLKEFITFSLVIDMELRKHPLHYVAA